LTPTTPANSPPPSTRTLLLLATLVFAVAAVLAVGSDLRLIS
jgi:hypothetical protein